MKECKDCVTPEYCDFIGGCYRHAFGEEPEKFNWTLPIVVGLVIAVILIFLIPYVLEVT